MLQERRLRRLRPLRVATVVALHEPEMALEMLRVVLPERDLREGRARLEHRVLALDLDQIRVFLALERLQARPRRVDERRERFAIDRAVRLPHQLRELRQDRELRIPLRALRPREARPHLHAHVEPVR